MATKLTKQQWIEILFDPEITNEKNIAIFQTIYSFENHQAYASQVGRLLGHKGRNPGSPLNTEVARHAKRIASKYDVKFTPRGKQKYWYWDLFFDGWPEGHFFVWKLKPSLVKALEEMNLTGEIEEPDEIPVTTADKLFEGAKRTITVNAYERNSQARRRCVEHHGEKCMACGFNFKEEYGEIGENFIHVHHLIPLYEIGEKYEVDPVKDLVPICPNCHAMIHKGKDMLSIEELKWHRDCARSRK
jgi:5-methylcytosine-specific restriction protein A